VPDFLVNDIVDPDDFPDTIYTSFGTTEPIVFHNNGTVSNIGNNSATIQIDLNYNEWVYIKIDDPIPQGTYLTQLKRSDGKEIILDYNGWRTYKIIRDRKRDEEIIDAKLHIVDFNSTGFYQIAWDFLLPPLDLQIVEETNSTIQFTWNKSPGSTVHRIFYKPTYLPEVNYTLATDSTPATAYTLINLEPGTAYNIK
jgi:hypothetical protein